MTDEATVLFGAVAAVLVVLVPLTRSPGTALRREIEGQGEGLRREIRPAPRRRGAKCAVTSTA